jgi:hypothetical protein
MFGRDRVRDADGEGTWRDDTEDVGETYHVIILMGHVT